MCIGNYGALVADQVNSIFPDTYKLVVFHLNPTVKIPATSSIGSDNLTITQKPKAKVIRKRVAQILPLLKLLVLDDGQRLLYQYLVYGEGSSVPYLR